MHWAELNPKLAKKGLSGAAGEGSQWQMAAPGAADILSRYTCKGLGSFLPGKSFQSCSSKRRFGLKFRIQFGTEKRLMLG